MNESARKLLFQVQTEAVPTDGGFLPRYLVWSPDADGVLQLVKRHDFLEEQPFASDSAARMFAQARAEIWIGRYEILQTWVVDGVSIWALARPSATSRGEHPDGWMPAICWTDGRFLEMLHQWQPDRELALESAFRFLLDTRELDVNASPQN